MQAKSAVQRRPTSDASLCRRKGISDEAHSELGYRPHVSADSRRHQLGKRPDRRHIARHFCGDFKAESGGRYKGFGAFTLTGGNFKEPFSLDWLTSNNDTMFMERSLAQIFVAPGRY